MAEDEQGGTEPSDALIADVFARDCPSRAILEDVASKWGILALLALGEGVSGSTRCAARSTG